MGRLEKSGFSGRIWHSIGKLGCKQLRCASTEKHPDDWATSGLWTSLAITHQFLGKFVMLLPRSVYNILHCMNYLHYQTKTFFFSFFLLVFCPFHFVIAPFCARVLFPLTVEETCFRMRIILGVVLIRSLVYTWCVPGGLRSGSGATW